MTLRACRPSQKPPPARWAARAWSLCQAAPRAPFTASICTRNQGRWKQIISYNMHKQKIIHAPAKGSAAYRAGFRVPQAVRSGARHQATGTARPALIVIHKCADAGVLQPEGLPAISRGLSAAIPPEAAKTSFRPWKGRSNAGYKFAEAWISATPFGVVASFFVSSGGVAALNPRLIA